ncbi:MAG: hypothetical protein AAGF28_04485 [Pseudomonadota bacterium]
MSLLLNMRFFGAICALVMAFGFVGWSDAANKVQTKRIQVPLETETVEQDEQPESSEEGDDGSGIPSSEFPVAPESVSPKPEEPEEAGEQTEIAIPEIKRDIEALPAPVQRMRELLINAAKTGDIENLRPLVGFGETATTLSIGGLDGDPIEHLKETSGDAEGFEILGILLELLGVGYVHLDPGTDEELYVWPYFFAVPFNKLTKEQTVELYTILTAGDVEESESFGSYVFYRIGIKPDGQWSFFVAGD